MSHHHACDSRIMTLYAGSALQGIKSRGGIATIMLIGALLIGALSATAAQAQTKIRVGKAQAQTFAFIPADIGAETGLFKKRGLDLEISSFAGDARLLQALTADALDIALGGGPTLAFVAKGAPMLAVAALADAPGTIMAGGGEGGAGKNQEGLEGRPPHRSAARPPDPLPGAPAVAVPPLGGPTLAFVAKGAPMLAVAALADAPGTIMAVVRKDGPVKTEEDLKGRTLSVSTAGSLTYWLAQQLSRSHGWGTEPAVETLSVRPFR